MFLALNSRTLFNPLYHGDSEGSSMTVSLVPGVNEEAAFVLIWGRRGEGE